MKILVCHNYYQQRGGEDAVMEAEVALLRRSGCEVEVLSRHNDELRDMSRLKAAGDMLWSTRTGKELADFCKRFRPDVIHAHNTFPLISPSLYWAAEQHGVPVVQTLHNFRLLCPQAMLLRKGRVCEDCLGKSPWRSVQHGCYRDSRVQSAALAGMLLLHRYRGSYRNKVQRYIALNEFCRDKFVAGGLPADKIAVKPNFVERTTLPAPTARSGGLFVGRLSPEKGIGVLGEAARQLPDVRFVVVGSGVESRVLNGLQNVHLPGFLEPAGVRAAMCEAAYLVMPSIWYETFGLVALEAFACGLPVIASRLGAMAELVEHQRTGLLIEPGNPAALAEAIRWAEANPEAMRRMGENARAEYEAKYTPEINLQQLFSIYAETIKENKCSQACVTND